jgi:hypothetical protein
MLRLAVTFERSDHGIFIPEKKKETYATLVPKNVNPVVTASVGKVSLLEEKPTCVKSPVAGTMYIDLVELKDTVVLLGEIVQAVVVESGSRVKVIFVATVAQEGVVDPT